MAKELQRAITPELALSPYFSIINIHLVDINVFAKFYEILSLPFQAVEKPKCRGWTKAQTDGQTDGHENSIPPYNKHSSQGGINYDVPLLIKI